MKFPHCALFSTVTVISLGLEICDIVKKECCCVAYLTFIFVLSFFLRLKGKILLFKDFPDWSNSMFDSYSATNLN